MEMRWWLCLPSTLFFLVLLMAQVVYFFTSKHLSSTMHRWYNGSNCRPVFQKLSERPWTIILTYMFSDTGQNLIRIISNMLWLWAFGYILQMTGNDNAYTDLYLWRCFRRHCFVQPIISLHHRCAFSNSTALLGANAGTMAVAMATTTLSPNHKFFTQIRGGIPIWVLMAAHLFIDLVGVASLNAAYSLSHWPGQQPDLYLCCCCAKGKTVVFGWTGYTIGSSIF